jgi:hypothetical protein
MREGLENSIRIKEKLAANAAKIKTIRKMKSILKKDYIVESIL